MSQTIELPEAHNGTKQAEWAEIGKTYGADELVVYEQGEEYSSGGSVTAKYGYELTWRTEEDDIHIFGDGKGEVPNTMIGVDSNTYYPESIKKLKQAIACLEEIEKHKRKFYNGQTGRPRKKKK